MVYTVTFYTLDAIGRETALTVHRVSRDAIVAYLDAPGVALAAARSVKGNPKPCGYRVVDSKGSVVLDYRDKNDKR